MEEGPPVGAQPARRPVLLFPKHRGDLGLVPFLSPLWWAPLPGALEEEERAIEQKPTSPPSKRHHALSPW